MKETNITKQALVAAMKKLMAQAPFARISVGDICQACGLSRKSFYYHFLDKYDLVNWTFYSEVAPRLKGMPSATLREAILMMCAYLLENRAYYLHAFDIKGQNAFSGYFDELFVSMLMVFTDQTTPRAPQASEQALRFITLAFRAALVRWLKEEGASPQGFMRDVDEARLLLDALLAK